jgi:hemerythrin-like domain-containing protein
MKVLSAREDQSVIDAPLTSFEKCHTEILDRLGQMTALPNLVAAADQSRSIASDLLTLFAKSILVHHADEEKELFPAVLADAIPGEEKAKASAMVRRLVDEHRAIEAAWRDLKSAVQAAAAGKPATLDAQAVAELVLAYNAHANYEETEFLPLAETILGRNANHMAALGLSLHMRHTPIPYGYI